MSSLYYHQQQNQQEHNNNNNTTNANDHHGTQTQTRTQTLTRIRNQTLNRTHQDYEEAQAQEQAALKNKNLTFNAAATAAVAAATIDIEQLRFNHEESEQQHQTQQAQVSSNVAMAAVAAEQQLRLNYEQQKQQQQAQQQAQDQERNLAKADAAAAEQFRFDHEEHQQQQAHAYALQAQNQAQQQQQQQQQQLRIVVAEEEKEEEYHISKPSRAVLQELQQQQITEGTQQSSNSIPNKKRRLSSFISVWDDSLWGENGNGTVVSDEVSDEESNIPLEKFQNTNVTIKPSSIWESNLPVREKFAITASNILSPSDDFSTQLCIDRMDCMPNYKKGTFIHDIAVVVSYMIVKEKISTTSKKLLVPPSIILEDIDSLASGMATCFKQNCTVSQFILSAMVVIFDSSIVPLQLSLPLPKKTERVEHYLNIDNNLEDFMKRRLCRAAYSVPIGMQRRPYGWRAKLTMEVVAYCDMNKITLPYSDLFIKNFVVRIDREQNSERLENCKINRKNNNKKRRMDPTKVASDAAKQKLYMSTPRAKIQQRECIRKKEETEMGYMPVDVPHIANLALQKELIYNFIENHKVGSCSKNSLSLKKLMNTQLNQLSFIDIDGVVRGDPKKSVKDKIRCIAVYSMQKQQWLFLQKKGKVWGWITFNKGDYVPYTCGPGKRESMRVAWGEMAKFVGSEHAFDVTVLEAQNKLRGFVGNDVLVDYNGCDTRGLVSWNNVIFENIKRFDFGQSVCFASNERVERIFGPSSTSAAHIHSINGRLETITNDLFRVGGKSWSQPIRGSICGPYLTCVEGELNYSDVVLDVQRLINLFVAIRTTYHCYIHHQLDSLI